MKKASKILYLVGAIISVVVFFAALFIVYVLMTRNAQIVNETINDLLAKGTITEEEVPQYTAYVKFIVAYMLGSWVVRIFTYSASAAFGFVGLSGVIKGKLNIIGIVLGVLAPTIFIPAGILGIIADSKKNKTELSLKEEIELQREENK